MIDKLTFSQRGHTILLGNTGLGVLNGLFALGKLCECAEDGIVDNSITEPRKKEKWHILRRSQSHPQYGTKRVFSSSVLIL